jgi:cytochrome c
MIIFNSQKKDAVSIKASHQLKFFIMNKALYLIIFLLAFTACKQTETTPQNTTQINPRTGKELFENVGNCIACHKANEKTAGPSLTEIAKIYEAKKGNLIGFLKGEAPAIVDPSQYAAMQINLEFTKTLSNEELKEIEKHIMGN